MPIIDDHLMQIVLQQMIDIRLQQGHLSEETIFLEDHSET